MRAIAPLRTTAHATERPAPTIPATPHAHIASTHATATINNDVAFTCTHNHAPIDLLTLKAFLQRGRTPAPWQKARSCTRNGRKPARARTMAESPLVHAKWQKARSCTQRGRKPARARTMGGPAHEQRQRRGANHQSLSQREKPHEKHIYWLPE
jgi:hypothetical protein